MNCEEKMMDFTNRRSREEDTPFIISKYFEMCWVETTFQLKFSRCLNTPKYSLLKMLSWVLSAQKSINYKTIDKIYEKNLFLYINLKELQIQSCQIWP